jgi:hypothetical protein
VQAESEAGTKSFLPRPRSPVRGEVVVGGRERAAGGVERDRRGAADRQFVFQYSRSKPIPFIRSGPSGAGTNETSMLDEMISGYVCSIDLADGIGWSTGLNTSGALTS